MGRPKIDQEKLLKAVNLVKSGTDVRAACIEAGIGRVTFYRYNYTAKGLK